MLSWEYLSPREQAQSVWWDAYKDAHGFRPRTVDTTDWTLTDFLTEILALEIIIRENQARQVQIETEAADKIERIILNMLECGAKDRDMAIRWLHEANGTHGDGDYLEYHLDLPAGYFEKRV